MSFSRRFVSPFLLAFAFICLKTKFVVALTIRMSKYRENERENMRAGTPMHRGAANCMRSSCGHFIDEKQEISFFLFFYTFVAISSDFTVIGARREPYCPARCELIFVTAVLYCWAK